MIKNIHRKYFEIWGDEQSQNIFLKGILLFLFLTNLCFLTALVSVVNKKPYVISINENASKVLKLSVQKTEEQNLIEIERVFKKFIKYRHNWRSDNLKQNLEKTSKLISYNFRKKFLKSNRGQLKEAGKKKITQRFYISKPIRVDMKKNQAEITGDRILIVDGLRATQPMTFKFNFIFRNRTLDNPEGIYITSENLISSLEQ